MEPYTFDLQRIFLGDLPLLFFVEILLRTVFLFAFTLILLRLVGHRELGQLSTIEVTLIIALGSAVGDPMLYADVPLLHGMLIIALIVLFQQALIWFSMRSKRLEHALQGEAYRVAIDGRLDLAGLDKAHVSRREVFSELRKAGIANLGQVRRAYMELDGQFSAFKFEPDQYKPGIPLLQIAEKPPAFLASDQLVAPGHYACYHCGAVQSIIRASSLGDCPECGARQWLSDDSQPHPGQSAYTKIANYAPFQMRTLDHAKSNSAP